jgi:hypothetical protein
VVDEALEEEPVVVVVVAVMLAEPPAWVEVKELDEVVDEVVELP